MALAITVGSDAFNPTLEIHGTIADVFRFLQKKKKPKKNKQQDKNGTSFQQGFHILGRITHFLMMLSFVSLAAL